MIALSNLGPNFHRVYVGSLTVWFSYETPVAFQVDHDPVVCSENRWSVTTGKHLNRIQSDKSARVPHDVFTSRLSAITNHLRGEGA